MHILTLPIRTTMIEQPARNSIMLFNEVYFWTSTIKGWKVLLKPDKYKNLILDLLAGMVTKKQIAVYGFILMPNHIHLIWEMLAKNGKESPVASFQKATAHLIVKDLKQHHPEILPQFEAPENDRRFRIWQRDPLAILLDSKIKANQKLEYIHTNPLQERWNLSIRPEEYRWSSAAFYEKGVKEFTFLTRFEERFG